MVGHEKKVGTHESLARSNIHGTSESSAANDEELLDQAVQGFRPALDKLIRRHEKEVYRLAYRFFHNHEEAQDAAQEVFVKVVHALPRFERRSSFKTWLYAFAPQHLSQSG